MLSSFLIMLLSLTAKAEFVFPQQDPFIKEKFQAISDIQNLMNNSGIIKQLTESNQIVFWANSIVLNNVEITVPSFTTYSENNKNELQAQIEKQCLCSMMGKSIAGVMIASPYHAAEMFFKENWMNHGKNVVDGYAPPIVIIYHEMGHASDYIQSIDYFLDIASTSDSRWKNGAEKSAVQYQNELALMLSQTYKTPFSLRRSYGKNRLYKVSDLYSTVEN